jgi:glycosyltransferase involved in cell wall biosynthesis
VDFTGYVDDVRPFVQGAQAAVIPLRVGGGTRIKACEAMSLGCPVVSTALGVEGLDMVAGEHYLRGDTPRDMAGAILELLADAPARAALSRRARRFVEDHCSHRSAAVAFERACLDAMRLRATRQAGATVPPPAARDAGTLEAR